MFHILFSKQPIHLFFLEVKTEKSISQRLLHACSKLDLGRVEFPFSAEKSGKKAPEAKAKKKKKKKRVAKHAKSIAVLRH